MIACRVEDPDDDRLVVVGAFSSLLEACEWAEAEVRSPAAVPALPVATPAAYAAAQLRPTGT